ncbi:myb domain-containing transcription factor [Dorcoceras hygrometricum]|uniref:Myb domain-containing transcription factor n=1 Tax=Dorcoceras hygrometricum TaxID=472368 RepID=A0A2Z7CN17_9LAMI|nr:myb domain-containing transcription factor [Dorcoceras hygrometricum]
MRESTRRGRVLVNVAELTGIVSVTQIRVNMSRYERWNLLQLKIGGAGFVLLSSFDGYQSGVVDRRVGGARRICSVREFSRQ